MREGWLERSLRSARAEVAAWPEWKRKAMRVLEVERSAEASRLDRALDLLERLVAAAERSAEAAERECELSDTSCGFFPRRFRRVEVDHGR